MGVFPKDREYELDDHDVPHVRDIMFEFRNMMIALLAKTNGGAEADYIEQVTAASHAGADAVIDALKTTDGQVDNVLVMAAMMNIGGVSLDSYLSVIQPSPEAD